MPSRQRRYGEPKPRDIADVPDSEAFRLVEIRSTQPPADCVGSDWFVYQIAQGPNVITGYRRGERLEVTADVERIIVGLNERRITVKGRPGPKLQPPAASASRGPSS